MKSKLKHIFGLFALVVMLSYQFAIIHYSHIHIENGTIISHMHGFGAGEKNNHHHSAAEYAKIDVLFHYVVSTLLVIFSFLFFREFIRVINSPKTHFHSNTISLSETSRGPPFYTLS